MLRKESKKTMKQAKNDNNSTYSKTHKKLFYVELNI